jgi:hypothetical protein
MAGCVGRWLRKDETAEKRMRLFRGLLSKDEVFN